MIRLIPAVLILCISPPSFGEDYIEFIDRAERFGVNFPGQPMVRDITTNADKSRTFVAIHLHARRLYILEATVPPNSVPPALFQQSLRILDENGTQIRYNLDADGNRTTRIR